MPKLKIDAKTQIPLRDSVYRSLRDAILKGELEPGTRLMEIHLANELGVSRTPVREAIRMLEQEGLAVTYSRKGARVMSMTLKDLEDVMEIREALDVLSAVRACENVTDEGVAALEEEIAAFSVAIETGDVRLIVERDESFHNIIYSIADNDKLRDIVTGLREQMYRYRYEYIKEKCALKTVLDEHESILMGIKNRDKGYVEEIMRTHLENQYDAVKNLILNRECKL